MPIQTHIDVQFTEISVMQMNINEPFPLQQLMRIRAYDDNGTDLTRYLNILSNRVNFQVPGTYDVPVFLQANNQVINQVDVVVHVLAPSAAANILPKITKDTSDIYVQQTNLPHPYKLVDFIKIKATDQNQRDITSHIVLNMAQVNYAQAGDYVVIIKAPDDQGNIAISTFHLHVLTEEQVDEMENGNYPDDTNTKQPVKARKNRKKLTKNEHKKKDVDVDEDDDDSHATYWLLIKKYWWIYIVLGILIFTAWDMFG